MSRAQNRWRELLGRFGLLLAFIAMTLVLSFLSDRFLTVGNVTNVLRQISVNALLAFGMTVVIIGAGIDLSVGSLLAFAGAIAAGTAVAGIDPILSILLGLLTGVALGAFNGAFVAYGRIAPFIVTLAGLTIFRGMTLVYTGGRPISGLPEAYYVLGNETFLGLPIPVWITLLFLLLTHFILRHTSLGRSVYAVGGNEEAAHLSGIRVARVKLFTYAYSGLAAGLAALVFTGRLNSAQPTAGTGYELDAIAAVVVGGTSLAGGRGNVWGTLLGALIIGVLNNGMNLLNVSSFYQQIVKGGVILAAVLIERLTSSRES